MGFNPFVPVRCSTKISPLIRRPLFPPLTKEKLGRRRPVIVVQGWIVLSLVHAIHEIVMQP